MSSQYKGMRWLKCDLQVQTPEDAKHWLDADFKLNDPRRPRQEGVSSEDDIQDKARVFLRRCHELELDVIGLTDHNFSGKTHPRDWFALHLVEQNKRVARELEREPLIILPGFEVDIGYHVLCLFGPAKKQLHLEDCNRVLTMLGLPENRRFERGIPRQLRHNDQRLSLKKLMEIVQGEHNGIVIAAHADQVSGLFDDTSNREDYRNPDLLAVELTQNPLTQKYQEIFSGKNPHWVREHSHPALIMSSDAKSLKQDGGVPRENSLGYRYTWIKMSEPSIESLRQAFLDHQSRIILPDDVASDTHPDKRHRQDVIQSVSIKNAAFLEDQDIHLSSGLNCIIGGRGSGKSTVLEYLRVILGKDKEESLDQGTKERIDRIRGTLKGSHAELRVNWNSADGVEDNIIWSQGHPAVQNLELEDPATFFNNLPVSFYSQQQLNRLTESDKPSDGHRQAQRLRDLVDGFNRKRLNALTEVGNRLKPQILESFSKHRRITELRDYLKRIRQELQELERQWQARSDVQEEADRHQLLKAEGAHLEAIKAANIEVFEVLSESAEHVGELDSESTPDNWPHEEWFKQYEGKLKEARAALEASIREVVHEFSQKIENLTSTDSRWEEIKQEIDGADQKFEEACAAKGLTSEDVGHLQEIADSIRTKQNEITGVVANIQKLNEEAGDPERLLSELHAIWRTEFEQRQEAATSANDLARVGDRSRPFIEVSAQYQCDRKSFETLWQDFCPGDRRKRLGKNWEEVGEQLFTEFLGDPESESPWQTLQCFLCDEDDSSAQPFTLHLAELREHIQENAEAWGSLRCSRVQDVVDMKLYRSDGTLAGSISEGSLSDGQRNTAALALLLTQKGGPLVIDQPEDELDSSFVFQELIPMLREIKPKRQVIMATHNANLPVNGDAELVCAFEAKNGRGVIRAEGGLDCEEVTKAVLDIMEGSAEAFRRRREKYRF